MNAPERLPIVRTAIDGAVHLPVELIAPSSTNPRRHPQDMAALILSWNLAELAASIGKHGVLQPIVVRPRPGAKDDDGQPQYEIVAGERRWRASQIAGQPTIIAMVRDMTDFDVLEVQIIENDQREDLHFLEQAEGYRKLIRQPNGLQGYATADELAERLGKSRRFVFNRLKLCELCPQAREACYAGKLTASLALLVARLPADVQPDATKTIAAGWGGEPLSYRQAQEQLNREYMLQLSKAPFRIADANLVPKAGSCRVCPKRTGANPDLFDDIKSADTCTDKACFLAKTDAHHAALLEQGKAEGLEVITGSQAKKVMPHQHGRLNGYMQLDKVDSAIGDKPLDKLLGKDAPKTVLIESPHTHEVVRAVREEDALAVLRQKGVIKTAKRPATNARERENDAKMKAATAWKTAAAGAILERVTQPDVDQAELAVFMWREVAHAMHHRLDHDTTKRVERLLGWSDKGDAEARILKLEEPELGRLFTAMCIAAETHTSAYTTDFNRAPRINRFAAHLGVDIGKIRQDLAAGVKAKEAEKRAAANKTTAAKRISTPPSDAAAQGTTSGPKTPEEALAKAVGDGKRKSTAKKVNQKDETAKPPPSPHLSPMAAWPFPRPDREASR